MYLFTLIFLVKYHNWFTYVVKYFKIIKFDDIAEINSYFDNFEGWLEYVDKQDKYDFQTKIIDCPICKKRFDNRSINNHICHEENKYFGN